MFKMQLKIIICYLVIIISIILSVDCHFKITNDDILKYRQRIKDMFYHSYNGYLDHAFDYDELKPLSCSGVNTWGNFHLTIIDSLDTLIIMKNYTEFNRLVKFLIENVNFDYDLNVSVFETNIRVVGGLLSAHLLSYKTGIELEEGWPCEGPLLRLADKMSRKLLSAFDTPTGLPYGTVNLLNGVPFNETVVSCTAGVGTFLLEFATLSRLTGDPVFEKVALKAIKSLHDHRSSLDLFGNHINTTDGSWVAIDSSIGGGVDSYFEYLVKGSIYLQVPQLLDLFNVYHRAIVKYMKRDDWHFSVNMNNGQITNPIFQSLESFWPGLLSLIGNLDEAKRIFLNNHQVWKQYGFLPEFYDVLNNEIKRNGYPLRPEHVESIFYLYKATKDDIYLKYAIDVIESIEHSAKTECGYATINDVRTHTLEDRQESFFLGETLKYLYLLFDHDNFIYNDGSKGVEISYKNPEGDESTCIVDTGSYVFNTEAHPFDSSMLYCCSKEKIRHEKFIDRLVENVNYRNVIENSILNNWINLKDNENDEQKERSIYEEMLDEKLNIDGLDCELEINKSFCMKIELKITNYSHCLPLPFSNSFAKYGEVIKHDLNG